MTYDHVKANLYKYYYPTGAEWDNPYRQEYEKGREEDARPHQYSAWRGWTVDLTTNEWARINDSPD